MDDGVGAEDRGLGGHDGVLPSFGVGHRLRLGDGPVDRLVAQQGEVVAAGAGEVTGEEGDGVDGVEQAVARAED
ncbi:hypothetical protein ACFWBB_09160 [Streptomyces sp. NPDC060000]|uniref:hypothetical protein n=1 Tax=Streptomyces sp. NPDC060000 TaxID=3347031 RepID=UPI0036A1855B